MSRILKALAIAALVITIAGAGLVLYAINTLSPVIEQTAVSVTPAIEAQDVYDGVMRQLMEGTFTGRVFGETGGLSAEDCSFITCTVRLRNRGFFPAEWISLEVVPQRLEDGSAYDVLQLDNYGAYVLGAKSRGDLAATILHAGGAQQTGRDFVVTCYVFGKQIAVQGRAQ
ncbi:MAG: hypothetical protein IJD60_12805 [Clostridia bacterium]|nr:hypothetical protein [Clostridia bacterium]